MPQQFYGVSALTRTTETPKGNLSSPPSDIISVRVKDIILNESHPEFKNYGEWNGIGTIFYDAIDFPFAERTANIAKPLFSNLKFYPLINELVSIVFLASTDSQSNTNIVVPYYLPSINIWNSQHHNALPDPTQEPNSNSQQDYQQSEAGVEQNVRRVNDNSTEINLGKGFNEKINTYPLQAFIGDYLIEGRWGNSIRFGSTTQNSNNEWSNVGESGSPIVIIRNGQPVDEDQDSWVPISENINKDQSSLYLTQGQKLPIEMASEVYDSYFQSPTKASEYVGNQIILNSDRLVFNAKNDHILLSSNNSISLNTPTSVNIDSPQFTIAGGNIHLGNKNATEPILRGDITISQLSNMIDALVQFFTLYSNEPPNAKIASTPLASSNLIPTLNSVKSILQSQAKSQNNFTI
tara:strand:- start:626 stop:1849 length:1224 start_codon:yes stop_codon:yes gene_type:complete